MAHNGRFPRLHVGIMSRIDESKIDYPPRVEAPPTPTVDPALIKKALGRVVN
jgi:hypothetical protein